MQSQSLLQIVCLALNHEPLSHFRQGRITNANTLYECCLNVDSMLALFDVLSDLKILIITWSIEQMMTHNYSYFIRLLLVVRSF